MTLEKGSACVKMAYLGSEMPGKGDGVFEKARKRRISSHTSFNTSLGRRGRESQDGAYRIIGIDVHQLVQLNSKKLNAYPISLACLQTNKIHREKVRFSPGRALSHANTISRKEKHERVAEPFTKTLTGICCVKAVWATCGLKNHTTGRVY